MEKASSRCEVAGRGFRSSLVEQWVIAKQPRGPQSSLKELKMKHSKVTLLPSTKGCQAGF